MIETSLFTPWCYKWMGLDWMGRGIDHCTMLISKNHENPFLVILALPELAAQLAASEKVLGGTNNRQMLGQFTFGW